MQNETVETCPQYTQNSVETMPESNCAHIADASGRVRKLFDDLKALGVVLSISSDGRLSVDGPELVMTDDLVDRVRADRDDLLGLVERLEERAAIVEHDGGLDRDDAERLARAEVPGQSDPVDQGPIVPEPVLMPSGVHCPYCRCQSFYAVPVGSVCAQCGRMAWVLLKDGSIRRADHQRDVEYSTIPMRSEPCEA